MLKDVIMKYYYEQDMNCAESMIRGANEYYGLGLDENAFHTLGGFGGGCCSGRFCGACTGGVATVSNLYIHTRAHAEDKARAHVKDFTEAFIERLGSDICAELKEKYMDYSLERSRCHVTVEKAAVLLEEMITKFREEDN